MQTSSDIPENDYSLMEAVSAGDSAALGRLYDKYSGVLMALCIRILSNRNDAEEVLLDVYWEVWRKASRYDPSRGAPLTYLVTLCRSRAIDRRRGMKFKDRLVPISDFHQGMFEGRSHQDGADPPEAMSTTEQSLEIQQALGQLSSPQRQALELAFFEGMSHREIAEKIQTPLGTVKSQIRQALIQLKDILRK